MPGKGARGGADMRRAAAVLLLVAIAAIGLRAGGTFSAAGSPQILGLSSHVLYWTIAGAEVVLGLAGFERARPAELSGGMRQRVSFLRTLMADKDVLLLDEPFGALDSITRAQLQEWLRQAMDAVPRTILLVTHDVEEALLLCQRVVVLSQRPGRVVTVLEGGDGFQGSRREIVTSPEFASLKERALAVLGP